jgi:uncharacterized membrane protein YfcA
MPALAIATVLGAVSGAVILLSTPGRLFRLVIPYLVLFSSLLLLVQPWLQRRLAPASSVAGWRKG